MLPSDEHCNTELQGELETGELIPNVQLSGRLTCNAYTNKPCSPREGNYNLAVGRSTVDFNKMQDVESTE